MSYMLGNPKATTWADGFGRWNVAFEFEEEVWLEDIANEFHELKDRAAEVVKTQIQERENLDSYWEPVVVATEVIFDPNSPTNVKTITFREK